MTRIFTFIVGLLCASALAAEPVTFVGAIGPYEIEMELDHDSLGNINGRYRYAGRDTWLGMIGEAFGQRALQISEYADGVETGVFYLETAEGGLSGYWVGGETTHPVVLKTDNVLAEVFPPEGQRDVSPGITGQYAVHSYWVNDWFAPGTIEIGFNGGDVNVVEFSDTEILVQFQFTVGPTYHLASFRGVAQKVDEGHYVHNEVLLGASGPCRLEFFFDETGLSISDVGNTYNCQFGARAHANFDLAKVGNVAEFEGFR